MDQPVNLQRLIADQQERWSPFAKEFAAEEPAATSLWRQHTQNMIAQREAILTKHAGIERDGAHSLFSSAREDERYLRGLDRFRRSIDELEIRPERGAVLDRSVHDTMLMQPLAGGFNFFVGFLDESIDVFGPPYASHATELVGGPHLQQEAFADRATGAFEFVHKLGMEGGFAYSAAAIWLRFMRRSPGSPPGQGSIGLAQVRPFVPYSYLWMNRSFLAPAHGLAGFGLFVSSRTLDGQDEQIELNHKYWIYSDGTSWFQHHHNAAFPDTNDGHALNFNDLPPWFMIRPGRIYSAAIWCFGHCDAHGGSIEQASQAAAAIFARVPFVVVAQTKN
jgi:hypothetical protein